MSDSKQRDKQSGQNLLSAVFYIVIVGLYAPVVYEKVKGGLPDLIMRLGSPEGFFSVFAFAFYSKVFCDDLREGKSDKPHSVFSLFLSWLFFLAQAVLWRKPVFSAASFAIGMTLIMLAEYKRDAAFSHRMMFNLIYAFAAVVFALIQGLINWRWSDIVAYFQEIACAAVTCFKELSSDSALTFVSYVVVFLAVVVLVYEIVQDYKKEVDNDD